MNTEKMTLVMLPQEQWVDIMAAQQAILLQLKELNTKRSTDVPVKYITAIQFMKLVNIKRTKFDMLAQSNKIKIIKKRRKIYLPVREVERYFNDINIP